MTRAEFLASLPKLIQNYQPAPAVLARINNVSLLIVIGPSGAGKTTIINRLDISYVPTDTTREPRPDEIEGVDFYFRKDYERLISEIEDGRLIQVAAGASGDLYATRASSYPQAGWAVMPVMAGVVPIFRNLGFANTLSVFIVPPTFEEWMRRMGSHGLTAEQLKRRLAEARRSLKFALKDEETHFILNDEVADATAQITDLLAGKINKSREDAARTAALTCLAGLD